MLLIIIPVALLFILPIWLIKAEGSLRALALSNLTIIGAFYGIFYLSLPHVIPSPSGKTLIPTGGMILHQLNSLILVITVTCVVAISLIYKTIAVVSCVKNSARDRSDALH